MNKCSFTASILACALAVFPLSAGERTIPVDMFIMIDKSLSMAEPGKFDSLHDWVRNQLIGQMLIDGDWVTIYQFYGEADNILTTEVKSAGDRDRIVASIDKIKPNGKFTDIGLALDTIKTALDAREKNDRLKVLLLLTDLKQEAPWTSRYAGSPDKFESPYLAEARIVQHDSWYEITVDMGIQDRVVSASRNLFEAIASADETRATTAAPDAPGDGTAGTAKQVRGDSDTSKQDATGTGLPLSAVLVVVSGILLAGAGAFAVVRYRQSKREDEENR
jgi:hypothetical protein